MWKDFFYFSHPERKGAILVGILLLLLVLFCVGYHYGKRQGDTTDTRQDVGFQAFRQEQDEGRNFRKRASGAFVGEVEKPVLRPVVFDPNTADSSLLAGMGLRARVVRNLLKYRAAGGRFRTPEALARIYGLDRETFIALRPYVRIASDNSVRTPEVAEPERPVEVVHARPHTVKYAEGTRIGLNRADTAELKKIPGIGSAYAARMVAYRKRIGGFHDVSQLKEIGGLPDGIERWFFIDLPPQRNLKINQWNVERLRSHPYLNFYQARAIVEHRHKYGPLESLSQLELYDVFTPADIRKLEPYVDFSL